MTCRISLGPDPDADVEVFKKHLEGNAGPYLEIGVMYAASMILAGATMPEVQLYGIDPFAGYKGIAGNRDPQTGVVPTLQLAERNLKEFGLEHRSRIFEAYHPPLPDELLGIRFGCVYVDGDHSRAGVRADWQAIKHCVDGVVIFHDLHAHSVAEIFDEVVAKEPGWKVLEREGPSVMGVVTNV